MCGVSGVELVVILVVAIIVIGPEKLPEVMGSLGKFTRDIRKATSELTNVRDDVARSIKESADEARNATRARTRNAIIDDEERAELDALRARRREKQAELDVDIEKLPKQLRPAARALSTTVAAGGAIASMGEKKTRQRTSDEQAQPPASQDEAPDGADERAPSEARIVQDAKAEAVAAAEQQARTTTSVPADRAEVEEGEEPSEPARHEDV